MSHPTPSARLINVCATALSSYGDIAEYAAGTYSEEVEYPLDVLRPAITEMMMVMADLQLIRRYGARSLSSSTPSLSRMAITNMFR